MLLLFLQSRQGALRKRLQSYLEWSKSRRGVGLARQLISSPVKSPRVSTYEDGLKLIEIRLWQVAVGHEAVLPPYLRDAR